MKKSHSSLQSSTIKTSKSWIKLQQPHALQLALISTRCVANSVKKLESKALARTQSRDNSKWTQLTLETLIMHLADLIVHQLQWKKWWAISTRTTQLIFKKWRTSKTRSFSILCRNSAVSELTPAPPPWPATTCVATAILSSMGASTDPTCGKWGNSRLLIRVWGVITKIHVPAQQLSASGADQTVSPGRSSPD